MSTAMPPHPNDARTYKYTSAVPSHTNAYLLPALTSILATRLSPATPSRLLDVGCGTGSVAAAVSALGWQVTGIDPSSSAIAYASHAYPQLDFFEASAYDALAGRFGTFPVVISLEVIEHCYYPRKFARTLFSCVEKGGVAILSTPYHGYLKNLALALSGKMDRHFTALWENGHIKFWSFATLRRLLLEAGFNRVGFTRVGRIPCFAKSMLATAYK